jgi:hypothetical protein
MRGIDSAYSVFFMLSVAESKLILSSVAWGLGRSYATSWNKRPQPWMGVVSTLASRSAFHTAVLTVS